MNGKVDLETSEYHAKYHDKGIPKKRMPKDSQVFGTKPSKY
jgi:hypothetical protein